MKKTVLICGLLFFVSIASLAIAQDKEIKSFRDFDMQELNNPKPVLDFFNNNLNKILGEVGQKLDKEIQEKNLTPKDKEYKQVLKKHFAPIKDKCNEFRNTLEKPEYKFALDTIMLNVAQGFEDKEWVNEIINNWKGEIKEELVIKIAEQYMDSEMDYDENIRRHLEDIQKNSSSEENKKLVTTLLDPFYKNPVGLDFPDFPEGKNTTDGKPLTKERFKGKILLVDFWATWCPPCRAEIPHLVEAYKEYKDKGFEIVGISFDKDKSEFEKYISENKIDWPQYFDGKGWQNEVGKRYFIRGIPTMYLLDKDGKVIANTKKLRGAKLKDTLQKVFQDKK